LDESAVSVYIFCRYSSKSSGAQNGYLPASKGRGPVAGDTDVQIHHPSVEALDHALAAPEVLSENIVKEFALDVTGDSDGFLLTDRSEDLLA
jgi:hypothetical protein